MLDVILTLLAVACVFFGSRADTALEILTLRQQVAVLKRQRPRPALKRRDRWFWITLRPVWPRGADVLALVKPETVVGWHRAGFLGTGVGGPDRGGVGRRSRKSGGL